MADTAGHRAFDEDEIRAAERAMELALAAEDRSAWVYDYTEDAVFDAGGHAVVGRDGLLEMASSMHALSDVSIRALRTEGAPGLAVVWCEASWTGGPPEARGRTDMRGVIVWRKEGDGRWRIALEHLA